VNSQYLFGPLDPLQEGLLMTCQEYFISKLQSFFVMIAELGLVLLGFFRFRSEVDGKGSLQECPMKGRLDVSLSCLQQRKVERHLLKEILDLSLFLSHEGGLILFHPLLHLLHFVIALLF
jgi:hypothetical protein